MALTLFGISNCDTVKRARTFLDQQGFPFTFHDFKKAGLESSAAAQMLDALGPSVLNRRGTKWRSLSPAEQAKADTDPIALMLAHPTVIKRPVWLLETKTGARVTNGFKKGSEQDYADWLAGQDQAPVGS